MGVDQSGEVRVWAVPFKTGPVPIPAQAAVFRWIRCRPKDTCCALISSFPNIRRFHGNKKTGGGRWPFVPSRHAL